MFWKKKETVSKAEHDAALALIKALENDVLVYQRKLRMRGEGLETADKQIQMERETTGRLIQRNRELQTQLLAARAEAEANKADAEKYRRSRANLKQFRKEPV